MCVLSCCMCAYPYEFTFHISRQKLCVVMADQWVNITSRPWSNRVHEIFDLEEIIQNNGVSHVTHFNGAILY